jgi:hypothetical protein
MGGTLVGMTPNTRAELLAAMSDNALEIEQTAARITGPIGDVEWQQTMYRIAALRKIQRDLEINFPWARYRR